MVRYEKNLHRPKDEVIADRLRRKVERAAHKASRVPKPRKAKKLVHHCDASTRSIRVSAPLTRKKCHEVKDNEFTLRLIKTNRFDRISVDVKQPTRFYLDWFWNQLRMSKSARVQTLIAMFPNVKEITESCAALFAAYKTNLDFKDLSVIVVGDGSTPRTGAIFTPLVHKVISVDPLLNSDKWLSLDPNAEYKAQTIQDWIADQKAEPFENTLIVAVHAHVSPNDYVRELSAKRNVLGVVTIECCVPQVLDDTRFRLLHCYQDWGIHSPCRTVRCYGK